jgi:group I intron endonuclease
MINGKRYIGQRKFYGTGHQKWQNYLGSGIILQKAIKKYGRKNFSRVIIDVSYSKEELDLKEIQYIKDYKATKTDDFYNLVEGGSGTKGSFDDRYTKEERKKKHDLKSKNVLGENNPNYKNSWNEEQRERMSLRMKDQYKGKNNPRAKSIICITTNKIFDTAKEAGEAYNVNRGDIGQCCKGKLLFAGTLPNKTKLIWMYYDEYLNTDKQQLHDKIKRANKLIPNPNCKKIMCLNNLKLFDSLTDAADWCNYKCVSNISNSAKGISKFAGKDPITGEKLHWIYYDDYRELNNVV